MRTSNPPFRNTTGLAATLAPEAVHISRRPAPRAAVAPAASPMLNGPSIDAACRALSTSLDLEAGHCLSLPLPPISLGQSLLTVARLDVLSTKVTTAPAASNPRAEKDVRPRGCTRARRGDGQCLRWCGGGGTRCFWRRGVERHSNGHPRTLGERDAGAKGNPPRGRCIDGVVTGIERKRLPQRPLVHGLVVDPHRAILRSIARDDDGQTRHRALQLGRSRGGRAHHVRGALLLPRRAAPRPRSSSSPLPFAPAPPGSSRCGSGHSRCPSPPPRAETWPARSRNVSRLDRGPHRRTPGARRRAARWSARGPAGPSS